mmetsp:Transcript_1725/g.3678  ORF Transcript_1725/g.3678 Transcript_1725/m.3678 type:complete len:106 (+) Transcript_1725:598-915(+)
MLSTFRARSKCFVVTYKYCEDMATRRVPIRENHLKHANTHVPLGLMVGGALQLPIDAGIIIYKTENEEQVRNFVLQDPYFKHGLITDYSIREYLPVIGQLKDQFS